MTNHEKAPVSKEISTPQVHSVESSDAPIEAVSGMEKVKEMAQNSASQDLKGGSSQQDPQDQEQKKTDALKGDRALMKERLLKNAPREPKMRQEVEKVLIKERDRLESDIKRHRRKKDYYGLSLAIMQLRAVMRDLKDLAKASYDNLKNTWLKVVHKFA